MSAPPDFEASDHPYLLLGSDVTQITSASLDRFNGALWIGSKGQFVDYYAKRHLVMFGDTFR